MGDRRDGLLTGLRVLVVEDEHLVALALTDDLEEAGAVVLGPASTVDGALDLIGRHEIQAAVLDIKLRAQMVFPVADVLHGIGVPFLFTTGFDAGIIPPKYSHVPKCEKPASTNTVTAMLARLAGRGA